MKLQERSYSTKVLRPKPLIHTEEDGSLIVVATSWGQPEHAQRALDEVGVARLAKQELLDIVQQVRLALHLHHEGCSINAR